MRRLFHFLGSVYFAIILITSVALVVIVGTLLESHTGSHRFAAHFTYGNPVFIAFLWGFFINILFASLRRWPFTSKHIPFLITHLGLLMILGGALMKSYYGIQGNLKVVEGSGSHTLLLPDTQAIVMWNKSGKKIFPLKKSFRGIFDTQVANEEDVAIVLKEYYPHCKEVYETWIKDDHLDIFGLAPFPIGKKIQARLTKDEVWSVLAVRKKNPKEAAYKAFLENKDTPLLLILQDDKGDIYLFAFQEDELVYSNIYPRESLNTLVVYDQGFLGYAVQATLPNTTLETPLKRTYEKKKPQLLLEENRPKVTVEVESGGKKETLSLGFDPTASLLMTKALTWLVRFQPEIVEIPYHLRLRQARQINYPDSGQPASFESDLIITDRRSKEAAELTISMNHVHETWDGYRFYLANIVPENDGEVKKVQLIVNYDPAKYFLTYPGAIFLTAGILLLFWFKSIKT